MPKISVQPRFVKAYASLPLEIQKKGHTEKVDKALRFLAHDPRYPSLRTKLIQGSKGLYEARVDRSYRMTYERLPNDTLQMRVVGKHDETLKNP